MNIFNGYLCVLYAMHLLFDLCYGNVVIELMSVAFDPAGRQFLLAGAESKLDSSDASFVEVWHTDDYGMGNAAAQGTVDIYFNGGAVQPGIEGSSRFIDPAVQTATLFFGGRVQYSQQLSS